MRKIKVIMCNLVLGLTLKIIKLSLNRLNLRISSINNLIIILMEIFRNRMTNAEIFKMKIFRNAIKINRIIRKIFKTHKLSQS
jgi:hypothetical protein